MKNSIVISQKSFMAELFYMFFWERLCFTPETNEVWFIIPHYSDGKFELRLHPIEQRGNTGEAAYKLGFQAAHEPRLRSTEPHDYGVLFESKMKELLLQVEYPLQVKNSSSKPGYTSGAIEK